jgi:parvulin-like peptidyl-prolyl isomerase
MPTGRPRVIALLLAAVTLPACSSLTEPVPTVIVPQPREPKAKEPEVRPAETAQAAPAPTPQPVEAAPSGEQVAASHVLIAYQGAMRAAPTITRTQDEAKKRAEQILARARKGEDFAKLASEASDDPSAKMNSGSLGKFTRERMVKPFADAAFALKPGSVSELVETPFGYHVIKRTE